MFDTFLAVILICAPGAGLSDMAKKCVFVQDKLGPVAQRVTCDRRLDELWARVVKDTEFLVRAHQKIGDFKTNSLMNHRGFCLDPQFPQEQEILKYYEP